MRAGMPKVEHPGHGNPQAGSIPGATRQHPSALDYSEKVRDIRQHEDRQPYDKVPVEICGFPNVQVMPALYGTFRTVILTGAGAQNAEIVVGGNPKVKRIYLMANTNPIWIGSQEQVKAATPNGALLPVGVWSPPFEGFRENLWGVATVGTSSLTVREEYWAD